MFRLWHYARIVHVKLIERAIGMEVFQFSINQLALWWVELFSTWEESL